MKIDHVCIETPSIGSQIEFFRDVFGETVTKETKDEYGRRKVWLSGGLQFNENPDARPDSGYMNHLAVSVDDLDGVLEKASKHEVKTLPAGRNWILIPGNICLELV